MSRHLALSAAGRKNPFSEQGFVLVATLFAVALIGLGAAYFASRVDVLRNNALETQRWAETEREAFSIRETLLHAAAIYPRDVGGLLVIPTQISNAATNASNYFATDGRAYRVSPSISVRVLDERGLLAVNTLDDRILIKLFNQIGIPADQHARMLDGLRDYIDPDDLKHLNGAERDNYLAANRAPPANDFLRTREQLADVMGWERVFLALDRAETLATQAQAQAQTQIQSQDSAVMPGVRERFLALFSTSRHGGVNVNSAPAAVLSLMPGINPLRVSALLDQRRIKPFNNLAELAPFANGPLDEEMIGLVGANAWRVTIAKAGLPFLLECQLTITPGEKDRPTRLKECRRRSPDLLARAAANEFALAISPTALTGATDIARPSFTLSRPPQTTQNEPNLADSNLSQSLQATDDTPAPGWLAGALASERAESFR
jgi:general secretion pathway protein K